MPGASPPSAADVLKVLHGSKRKEDTVTKLSSGQWQAGNVAKVLKNQTTRTWLASQAKQQAA
jgi:ABC-type lipoprotein export system ATPase subunit